MIVDVHCHYTFMQRYADPALPRFSFEPAQIDGAPAFDSCLAPRILRRATMRVFQLMMGLGWRRLPPAEMDRRLAAWYAEQLEAPGPVEKVVLLAFDRYHDAAGRRPPFPGRRRELGSDMYTSNSLVRAACRRRPDRFLFGASVHPYRERARECIDEVFAAGACLLKWLPLHQHIDCRDERTVAVLRRCGELGLPVLVHYGEEFTLATQHPECRPIAPLLETLRALRRSGCMPTTIVAHVATSALPWGEHRSSHVLMDALLGEFRAAPLYADISAMTAFSKVGWLRRLARRQDLHAKFLFGSDFPVPIALARLRRDLGRDGHAIKAERSWIQRAVPIYRACGFNEIVFHRAATLLPHLDHFCR